jgi:isopenicillin-N N-acyltransferase-like protein
LLAHADDQVANIEMTVEDDRVIYPEDGVVCHTNHYVSPAFEELDLYPEQEDSRTRLRRLVDFADQATCLDERALEELLSDHTGSPHSICKHVVDDGRALKTVASCVISPSLGRMRLSLGNPCINEYVTLAV